MMSDSGEYIAYPVTLFEISKKNGAAALLALVESNS